MLRAVLDVLDRASGAAEKNAPAEQKLRPLTPRYEKKSKKKIMLAENPPKEMEKP